MWWNWNGLELHPLQGRALAGEMERKRFVSQGEVESAEALTGKYQCELTVTECLPPFMG